MNKLLYTTEEVLGTPTLKNYFFSTKAHFDVVMEQSSENLYIGPREVEAKWEDMKQTSGFEFHSSPKSVDSEYLVDVTTGDIYRKSQHWGNVASCEWTTGNHDAKICYRHYCIAKCNIKDFVFRGKIMYLYVDDIKRKYLK